MLTNLKKFISENDLIKPGDRILLAVSGGIDSMVMAHLFLQLSNETGIAHCNFSLRNVESDNDEKLVRDYSGKNNIPFYSIKFDTTTFAKEHSLSIQMAARDLRYNWFEEIRTENGYDTVAVAHNLNDNTETLLINLIRGTGISGLTGMRPRSNKIIRPLLFATRNDITEYCNENHIIFREDRSNADTKYTRNKIRHLVIPVLREINPSVETTLNDTADRLAGINEIVAEYIGRLREELSTDKNDLIVFNINKLKGHLHNPTIIFELFRPFGLSNVQLNDLVKVIEGKTGGLIITKSHRIIKDRKTILISCNEKITGRCFEIENLEGFQKIPGFVSATYTSINKKFNIPTDTTIACIDSEKIKFPLTIRKWKSGDHFHPLGMKQNKKLSDYFIDKKYSKLDKENTLILESEGVIVWIIGDRIDDRYKITPLTRKVLILKAVGNRQ